MDKIIQNLPNDDIAIICNIKDIDKDHHNYAIVIQEVAFGKVDEYGYFSVEDTGDRIKPAIKFDINKHDEKDVYYIYPVHISDLKNKYKDKQSDIELAIAYFKSFKDDIILLYKEKEEEDLVIEQVSKKAEVKHENTSPILKSNKKDTSDNPLASIKRKELATYLKQRILKNDSLMDDIATVIVANFRTNNPSLIKNIMCVGPTGSGKTKTFQLIAEYADIPITVIDCNQLTAEGFVGKGMDDIFKMIYATSKSDISKAERSIVMLDEIDKIASRGDPIKDLDVQQGLLKVLEGYKFSFENKRGSSQIQMDTSFMTKVGSGAFMDMFDKRKQKHSLGFNSVTEKLSDKVLTDKDIIDYGFLPEFVGRFPLIYTYKPLDEEGLKQLLTQSKISPLVQIQERLNEEYGCNIEYDDEFLYEIIQEALKTEAGGRSLSKIISQSFIKLEGAMIDEVDLGHEIPKVLKLDREMIKNPNKFNL